MSVGGAGRGTSCLARRFTRAALVHGVLLMCACHHVLGHGSGCEKKLDKVCPDWRTDTAACLSCVQNKLTKLQPECTEAKARSKCQSEGPPSPPPLPPKPHRPPSSKPNVVVVLTDDQDIMLGSMNAMSFTRALGQQGANFSNFFAHTPVCCPSR